MRQFLKIPPEWTCNFRLSTLIAIAAGLGAASGYGLLSAFWLLLPGAGMLLLSRKQLYCVLIAFTLCFISGNLNRYTDRIKNDAVPMHTQTVSGTILCIDNRCSALDELPPLRSYLCEIQTEKGRFTATVLFPDSPRIFYGDAFNFTGIVVPPKPAGLLINNGEITGELPPSYGNRPLLIVRNYSFTGTKPTFFRPFLHCRDFLLRRMISHFHTTQAAEMAAKLFFGATKGMDRENRKNFINTGTIHLFSISGLHVTLVAGIFLLLLRPVPFAWRYRITALLTLFYVLCSGAPLPAIRAGAMVMIWCILRSMLFKSSSWNSIMITWSIFALIAPSTTGSLSAQYSFGITAALILLLERSGEYTDNYRKILAMMPPGAPLTLKFRKRFHRLKNLTMYLLVPLTAFAAGCGMSLYRQNLFVPGSIFANLILTFFTPGLFIAMFFKMIAGTFSVFFDQCGAFLLESIFFLFSDIAAETAGLFTPVSVGKPPLWSVLIYYLFFFGTLGLKSHRNRIFMLCGTIVILFSWQFFSPSGHRFIAVSYGCNSPAMLVLLSPGGESTVVNAPDPDSAAAAGMLMKEYGTLYASLYFSNRSASTNYGIGRLNDCLLRVTAYEPDSSRKATKAFLRNINHSEAAFFREPGNLRIIRQHKDIFICRTAQGFEITSRISDSGRTIQIQTPDGKIFRETLPWCSLPVVWQCDLK